jgi:nitrite reductase (NO-forming)
VAIEADVVIEGSGEKYAAWIFNGTIPRPVVRVAAEIDFLKNYRAINAGKTIPST